MTPFCHRARDQRLGPAQRVAVRSERSRPLITVMETGLREQRAMISKNSDTGKAIDYSLKRWTEPARFLDDGRLSMYDNAAKRELAVVVRPPQLDLRRLDEGGRRAAALAVFSRPVPVLVTVALAWLSTVLVVISPDRIAGLVLQRFLHD
jgi:transposase